MLLLVRLPLEETDPSLEVPPFPLGVRWKFRPFARLPEQRVHSVLKSWLKLVQWSLRNLRGLVLKLNEFKKK
jgi:hypothetical protein